MKCRDCPLSLRCLAGRLGNIALCPACRYLTVGDVVPINMRPMNQVRLRCVRRISVSLSYEDCTEHGAMTDDPVMSGPMAITLCAKCIAIRRIAAGVASAVDPSAFDAVELD